MSTHGKSTARIWQRRSAGIGGLLLMLAGVGRLTKPPIDQCCEPIRQPTNLSFGIPTYTSGESICKLLDQDNGKLCRCSRLSPWFRAIHTTICIEMWQGYIYQEGPSLRIRFSQLLCLCILKGRLGNVFCCHQLHAQRPIAASKCFVQACLCNSDQGL